MQKYTIFCRIKYICYDSLKLGCISPKMHTKDADIVKRLDFVKLIKCSYKGVIESTSTPTHQSFINNKKSKLYTNKSNKLM